MSNFKIGSRWTSRVVFECDLPSEIENQSFGMRAGFAVMAAIKAKIDLRGSDLRGSDLRGSDLSNCDLRGSDLSNCDLRGSDLRNCDLLGSDLRNCNLRGSYLSNCDLRGSDLRNCDLLGSDLSNCDLRGSDLRGSDLSNVPIIPNIHQAVYEAASSRGGALNMTKWHTCETTHCRAGWVVHLAGADGAKLENRIGTPAAAALIYIKSDPSIERIPDFYESGVAALEDMRRLAEIERAGS